MQREIGNYRILEEIGHGGMGTVYRGIHSVLKRQVAIKMLKPLLTDDSNVKERFLLEAQIQANLRHSHIVSIHDFIEHDGRFYIVMDYIEGRKVNGKLERTLADAIRNRGALSEDEIMNIMAQVLDALGYAHEEGVLHRDIKPSNILFDEEGSAYLSDFGIAKILGGEHGLTSTGATVGTPFYMSPEQVLNKGLDARTDIYSLGVTLYQMATGKLPFEGDSDYEIMNAHVSATPEPPRKINPNISGQLAGIILHAMRKDPTERFRDASEWIEIFKKL